MDNLSLEVLVNELRTRVLNASIQRIKLMTEKTLLFVLRSRVTEHLIVCLYPSIPNLCILSEDCATETSPSDGLLALRKYLVGGRITALRKSMADRVVHIEVETYRLTDKPERFTLVIDLIPSRVRACLLDAQQQVQMWLAPSGFSVTYTPPVVPACRVDTIRESEFGKLLEQDTRNSGLPIFGLSSWFAREVLFHHQQGRGRAWQALQGLLQRVSVGPYSPRIYTVEEEPDASIKLPSRKRTKAVIAPFALGCLAGTSFESFPSMNALCEHQFLRSLPMLRGLQLGRSNVSAEITKKQRLKEKLLAQLRAAEEAQSVKIYADLLYAQHDKTVKGTVIRVSNLFDPQLGEVDIPLQPELSIIENANRYQRLYRKARRSVPQVTARLRVIEQEIAALQRAEERLLSEPTEVESKEGGARPMKDSRADQRKRPATAENTHSRPDPETLVRRTAKVFQSSEGWQILVGKSSKDNDVLTLKVARSEDFWLHVAGYGGSHVVLRNPEKLAVAPKQSLLEAAQLAAYFSQARNAPKVEVHYTQKKFVSKPKGAKPGLVRLKEHKSILARPRLLSEAPPEAVHEKDPTGSASVL